MRLNRKTGILGACLLAATLLGCSDDAPDTTPSPADAGAGDAAAEDGGASDPDAATAAMDGGQRDGGALPRTITVGGARPAEMWIPRGYDGTAHPLVILLHGYGSSADERDRYFGLSDRVDERGFFLLLPNGTPDFVGNRFWNATDACCDFGQTGVDDVAYLVGLIDEASERFNVDAKRVYLWGHSNGGFMAYRMACDATDRVAAVVSLAGATYADAMACGAEGPVSVLQVHGTDDATIEYPGGRLVGIYPYPGAEETVGRWASRAGCAGDPVPGPGRDLVADIPGAETRTFAYETACQAGIGVRLWRMDGAGHIPRLQPTFADQVLDFLLGHPKP